MPKISSFIDIENKHDVFNGKDCMKIFKRACNEDNYFQKKIKKYLQMRSSIYMKMQKFAVFLTNNFQINILKIRNIVNLEMVVIIHMNREVLHIVYVI